MKKIGIVGGMGAIAGVRLVEYLVQKSQRDGAMLDHEFPEFVLHSIPISGMDETGIIDPPEVLQQLNNSLSDLNSIGCTSAIIACNSAHVLFSELNSYSTMNLLNVIQLACADCKADCVGVLSSASTRTSQMYEQGIAARKRKAIIATDEEQSVLNSAIKAVISNRQTKAHFMAVERVALQMTRRGAEEIIIGCTELPLVIGEDRMALRFIDAGKSAINHALKAP